MNGGAQVLEFQRPGRAPRPEGVPIRGCPVCGDRRFFYRLSEWEVTLTRAIQAVCGCMNGLSNEDDLVREALGRGALLQPCNAVLVETVQRIRSGA